MFEISVLSDLNVWVLKCESFEEVINVIMQWKGQYESLYELHHTNLLIFSRFIPLSFT